MRTSGTRTTPRRAALPLVVVAVALGALLGVSARAAPGGAEGVEARSAGAEGGAAPRARAGPSRLWYLLSIDYRGHQLVTSKTHPTGEANQTERVHPAARLIVRRGSRPRSRSYRRRPCCCGASRMVRSRSSPSDP